jgi:short-subunit dehydrogenase
MATSRSNRSPKLSIVTGASSGLGRALSERLAENGSNLVVVARNQERLEACAREIALKHSVHVEAISADLAQPDAPDKVFDRLQALGSTADVLVNNAGFNVYGRFEDADLDKELEMIRLHVVATTQLTKLFLEARDKNRRNRILNVSSIAGLVPGPFVSVHFATRAHMLSFSLALSEEFKGTDVDVTCLCPGPMKTDFFRRAGMQDVRLASGWPLKTMTASDVAGCGYDAMLSGKRMAIPGRRNRLFAFAADIAPRRFKTRFTEWIMGRL